MNAGQRTALIWAKKNILAAGSVIIVHDLGAARLLIIVLPSSVGLVYSCSQWPLRAAEVLRAAVAACQPSS